MDAVTSFYDRLITGQSPIDPLLQVRIVEHLVRSKDFSLLGKLAARVDLCPPADALISARNEALVLAGWASRPGRTHDELIARLLAEKRVSTLLPLTKLPDLPEAVYMQIATRRSVKLTEALMVNPSVSAAIKMYCIDDLVAVLDAKSPWQATELLEQTAANDPSLLQAISRRSTSPSLVTTILDKVACIDAETVTAIVEHIDDLVEHGNDRRGSDDDMVALLELLAVHHLDEDQLKTLRRAANIVAKRSASSYWQTSCKGAKLLLSASGRDTASLLRDLETSTDAAASSTLLRQLRAIDKAKPDTIDGCLQRAIARNTVLPVELVKPFLEQMPGKHEERVLSTWLRRGELSALAEIAAESYGPPYWLESSTDPVPLLRAVVEFVRSRNDVVPGWVLAHPAVLESTDTALQLLPWQYLHQVGTVGWWSLDERETAIPAQRVIDAAQKLLTERMGTNRDKWEVFLTLANEFEGPLPELLDTVDAIAA